MSQAAVSNYFQKSSSFKVNRSSLLVFVFAAFIAWEINIIGQMAFPSHHLISFLTRITINLICDFALLYVSYTLLKRNNIPFSGYSIVITTTMCSFIFGLSFILTRSMWTSIASHATANIFLHVITGLDGAGTSVYKPVFEQAWPKQYDAGLLCMVAGAIIVTALLYMLTLKKSNSVNLNA